jgi:cytoskeleton protein RodZ
VTDTVRVHDAGVAPPAARPTAGAMLRAAREGAGLSVDAVAQQLKLAPRQVRAIEESDHAQLPGRTFVRGFVRNYARLVRLDIDAVLAALPDATAAQETPSLQAPAADMGELPAPEGTGLGWTRWAIPAAMIAIVAALAIYQFLRPAAEPRREPPAADVAPASVITQAPAPNPNPAPAEPAGTPLTNPVASAQSPGSAAAPGEPPAAPASTLAGEMPPSGNAAPAPAVAALPAPATAAPAKPAVPTRSASVMLAFRDYSWTEARDKNGVILMSRMNPGGSTQTITGDAPLDLVIGNAADVTVTFKGARVDLVPFTKQNVARLTLR